MTTGGVEGVKAQRQGGPAGVAVGALVATIVAASTIVPVGAQAGGEPPGFVPGEATAIANTIVLGLSPGGGKPIDISLGRATARFQNRTANSEGVALGLGLLQIFFGPSSQCGDRPPIIPAEQLPPVSSNDSRRNQPMATALEVRSPGTATTPGGVLGTQIANAQADPQQSTAGTTTVSQDYGVMAVDGAHTEVSTKLARGVREATAVTTATRIRVLGDMVVIHEPRWEAVARTGGVETSEARFTFTSASIFGIERTAANFPGDFADFANGVAGFLSGLGVTLQYPKVVSEPGRITMTPLVVGLANPPIGLDFIQPLLTQLAPLKEENTRNLIAEDCNNEAILQIADLALGVLSGSGAITLSVGGVTAFTAATEFPEPAPLDIGEPPPLEVPAPQVLANSVSPVPTPSFDLGGSSYFDSDAFAVPDVPVETPMLPPEVAVETPVVAEAPVAADEVQQFELPTADLVSRRYEPGTTGGAAAVVGALGLAGLLLLACADRFVMRRTKREVAG